MLLEMSLFFPGASRLKHLHAIWETWVWSLGWEDPLEKEMATHFSILAWRIPWMEEPGGLQSMGSKELDTTELLHFHFHFGDVIDDDEDLDEQVWMKGMAWKGEAEEGTCPSFFLRIYTDRQIHSDTMWFQHMLTSKHPPSHNPTPSKWCSCFWRRQNWASTFFWEVNL